MSFIYAEKNTMDEEGIEQSINILSDTKTTLTGAVLANWNERQRAVIKEYGFLKSVIIGPTCCISFSGNDTSYAQKLLKWIFEKRLVSDEEMLEKAMQLHLEPVQYLGVCGFSSIILLKTRKKFAGILTYGKDF